MFENYSHNLFLYLDNLSVVDRCWTDEGFFPEEVPGINLGLKVFAASYCCFTFFETNGLGELLECEFGRAIPEFIQFLRYSECFESQKLLGSFVSQSFPNGFVRDSIERFRAVEEMEDERISEMLGGMFRYENLNGRLQSFAAFHCERLSIPVEKPEFVISAFIPREGMWEREFCLT